MARYSAYASSVRGLLLLHTHRPPQHRGCTTTASRTCRPEHHQLLHLLAGLSPPVSLPAQPASLPP